MNTPFLIAEFDKAVIEGKATWWQMDLPSGNVYFGDSKTDMLGYKESSFKNYKDFMKIVHPDDQNKVMDSMMALIKGKTKVYEATYRIRTKNGGYISFYDCGQITKKEGENISVMGFVLKTNEHEDALEQMKDFREMIVGGNPTMAELMSQTKKY